MSPCTTSYPSLRRSVDQHKDVRSPVESLVGVGGHRNEAYRQSSTIVCRQPYWIFKFGLRICSFLIWRAHLQQISRAQRSRIEYRAYKEKGSHHLLPYL